ncbi:regulatory protein, luxR family [Streptomyces sp. TLI_053]|uniref:ATP-binding protein n=1 Tax=Streptomyces sp. TLI_053 TaxID=1855352 RepID=UPI00087BEF8B|nr:AAA family ATPase [Streptomyces sp. TLI_053]SDS53204.1 regulatory protein, luxR family [Streptomyces sp. TLI_053]
MPTADATRREHTAFVGRENELADLHAALEALPAVTVVEGEAGIGKSRLLLEATGRMRATGTHVLWANCYPLRHPYPFQPVLEALHSLRSDPPAGASPNLVSPAMTALLAPAPSRSATPAAPPAPAAYDLVADLKDLLRRVAPVVLVIEDMQWSDESSRELLLLLAANMPDGAGLVLSHRRSDLLPHPPLLGAAYHPQPAVRTTELQLTPLPPAAVRDLASRTLGSEISPRSAERLHARSDGVPRTLIEDLTALRRHLGRPPHTEEDLTATLDTLVVPRVIRETVTATLQQLPPEAVTVVRAAAALDNPFDLALVADVAGISTESASKGISAALTCGLLREAGPTSYTFRRSAARTAVYQDIPGPDRKRMHRHAISTMWTRPSPPLAHIAQQARQLGDTALWIQQANAAAGQATARGDRAEATRLLLEVLQAPTMDTDTLSRAALMLARNSFHLAQHKETLRTLRRTLARPGLPARTWAELTLHTERLAVVHAGDSGRIADLRAAATELQADPALAAEAASTIAMAADDEQDAQTWLDAAQHAAAASGDTPAAAVVRTATSALAAAQGDEDFWKAVENTPRRPTDPHTALETNRTLCTLGSLALGFGLDTTARRLLTDSQAMAGVLGSDLLQCQSATALALLDWWTGAWNGLPQRLQELHEQYPEMAMAEAARSLTLANLCLATGEHDRAFEHLRRAADRGGHYASEGVRAALARLHLDRSEPEEAWRQTAHRLRHPIPALQWRQATGLLPVAVQAALATGRPAEARTIVTGAEQATRGRCTPAPEAEIHQARGHMSLANDPALAAAHYARARSLWHDIGRPYQSAQASEQQADALLRAGRPDEAAVVLRTAKTTYNELGASNDESRCQDTLRTAEETKPKPRGRRSYGQDLSPRELEVARLVADGATNREIAGALFLSLRTVEHHVTKVLRKLDVSHRREVNRALLMPR